MAELRAGIGHGLAFGVRRSAFPPIVVVLVLDSGSAVRGVRPSTNNTCRRATDGIYGADATVTNEGPKLRAGFRLVPEIGAPNHTRTATSSQVMSGVQRISHFSLRKMKMANTRAKVMPNSARKTNQIG